MNPVARVLRRISHSRKSSWPLRSTSVGSYPRIPHHFRNLSTAFHTSSEILKSRPSFGIAFDIDGVLLRGKEILPGAQQALARLHHMSPTAGIGSPRVPYVFLTNGGGMTEEAKAAELQKLLGVPIMREQVILGHTPFRMLASEFGGRRVLAVGKNSPVAVMEEYGFRDVVAMEDFVAGYPGIDPLAPHKPWAGAPVKPRVGSVGPREVSAVFITSDPVDWSRDLQVLLDVLRSGGDPMRRRGRQVPLFLAADDFEYQASFEQPRLGMGAFRIALQTLFERSVGTPMEFVSFGKPTAVAFQLAEQALQKLAADLAPHPMREHVAPVALDHHQGTALQAEVATLSVGIVPGGAAGFARERKLPCRLFMVGDNPETDIIGACQAGPHWVPVLTRTGIYKGTAPHTAHQVVDGVEDAIDFILELEGMALA